jgi:hypothetical protein
MSELISETAEEIATAATRREKPPKKAGPGARKQPAAVSKAKAAGKAGKGKKAPTAAPKERGVKATKAGGVREGSKTETILGLLKRPGGATLNQILRATGWQAHSVRGFVSGTLGKKMGLTVLSSRTGEGDRTYSIKA